MRAARERHEEKGRLNQRSSRVFGTAITAEVKNVIDHCIQRLTLLLLPLTTL
jgi:hypothetical protein